jgi:hypothetical protein
MACGNARIEVNNSQRDQERIQGGVVLLGALALVGSVTRLGKCNGGNREFIDPELL